MCCRKHFASSHLGNMHAFDYSSISLFNHYYYISNALLTVNTVHRYFITDLSLSQYAITMPLLTACTLI